jgi:DNA polymerase III epsilon subunit-like protein
MTMTWEQLLYEYQLRGWHVIASDQWIEVQAARETDGLAVFRRDAQGLHEATQFFAQISHQSAETFDQMLTRLRALCEREREAGRINGLSAFASAQRRRQQIPLLWQRLEQELQQVKQAIHALPSLPDDTEIRWAQSVLAMNDLAFMEIDTTGLDEEDEMTRFTLLDASGQLIVDLLIKPETRPLSPAASVASGITPEQLARGLSIEDAWERIQGALSGRYVVSFSQDWDMQQLDKTARRHRLEPVLVIGACLQRHATRYYHGEYYLKLEELCARAGAPLPERPHQTSLDRARGQRAVLHALAHAITDLRTPLESTKPASKETADEEFDPFLDEDDLP